MSHIRHYQVLPWATGPLTSLESITKVPDQQVAKTGKSSIFWLSFFFFSSVQTVSQDSMITAEAITTIQTRKNAINHWILHSLLIVILALELFFRDSQALRCQYLVLYAILLAWITLFIACTPQPRPEAQLSTCLVTVRDEDGNIQGRVVY